MVTVESRLYNLRCQKMVQIVFNHVRGKPPHFDDTCYDYWKRKMKMYLGSINDKVWDVTESDY
jgi:hypothetical protein